VTTKKVVRKLRKNFEPFGASFRLAPVLHKHILYSEWTQPNIPSCNCSNQNTSSYPCCQLQLGVVVVDWVVNMTNLSYDIYVMAEKVDLGWADMFTSVTEKQSWSAAFLVAWLIITCKCCVQTIIAEKVKSCLIRYLRKKKHHIKSSLLHYLVSFSQIIAKMMHNLFLIRLVLCCYTVLEDQYASSHKWLMPPTHVSLRARCTHLTKWLTTCLAVDALLATLTLG